MIFKQTFQKIITAAARWMQFREKQEGQLFGPFHTGDHFRTTVDRQIR